MTISALSALRTSIVSAVPVISKETKASLFTKAYFVTVGLGIATGVAQSVVPGGVVNRDFYAEAKVTKK